MTDREKIRAYIEKLHKEHRGSEGDSIFRRALRTVLFYIDSMQEEHCTETEFREIEILRTKLSDIAKAIYYHEGKENPTVERIREIVQDCCFELMDLKKPKQEGPVNEEWIEELRTKLDSMSKEDFKKVFDKYAIDFNEEPVSRTPADIEAAMQEVEEKSRAFTEAHHGEDADTILAQMRGEEPVSEGLEEAAREYSFQDKFYLKSSDVLAADSLCVCAEDAFIAGAQWQKRQMMAKAIDGVVTFDYYDSGDKTYGCIAHDSFCLEDLGLKDTDKVRMILIKEG